MAFSNVYTVYSSVAECCWWVYQRKSAWWMGVHWYATQCITTMKIEWAMCWWQTIIDFGKHASEQAKANQGKWLQKWLYLPRRFHVNYSISKHFNFCCEWKFFFFWMKMKSKWNAESVKKRGIKQHNYCLYIPCCCRCSLLWHFFRC